MKINFFTNFLKWNQRNIIKKVKKIAIFDLTENTFVFNQFMP